MTPTTTRFSSGLLARAVERLVVLLLLTLALALWPHSAHAADITVDGATCTLPDAITAANIDGATGGCLAGSGADTLLLTAPTYPLATGPYSATAKLYDSYGALYSEGMSATPSVTTSIVISGGIDGAIVERSGSDPYRLFYVGSTGNLTIQKVTIRYGKATPIDKEPPTDEVVDSGGAIFNRGTLTLVDSEIFSNTAPSAGGGIYNHDHGTVNLVNVDFLANVAGAAGGGLASRGIAILKNSVFISNTAGSGGGFSNGDAQYSRTYLAKAILSNCDFISNTARSGGGLSASGPFGGTEVTTELTNVNFIANQADYGGGFGGGSKSSTTFNNTNFISNRAQFGGGISREGQYFGSVILTNSHLISNTADYGGGIYNYNQDYRGPAGTFTISDSEIRANRATFSGGALYQDNTFANIVNSRLVNNWAGKSGGAILQDTGEISIAQSCLVNNSHPAITNQVSYPEFETIGPFNASNNWWGAADGPSSVGLGTGDSVSNDVTFTPFLTSAILNCPTKITQKTHLPDIGQSEATPTNSGPSTIVRFP